MGEKKYESIHRRDLIGRGNYWVLVEKDLIRAIDEVYWMSGSELRIFLDIVMYYESKNQTPYPITYEELGERLRCAPSAVSKCIKKLIEKKLIIRCNERKGRAKSVFAPNSKYLRGLLDVYWRKEDERKNPVVLTTG